MDTYTGWQTYRLECRGCRYQSLVLETHYRSVVKVREGQETVLPLVASIFSGLMAEHWGADTAEREGRMLTTTMWHCQVCGENTARHAVWSSKRLPGHVEAIFVGVGLGLFLIGAGLVWLGAWLGGESGAMVGAWIAGILSLPGLLVLIGVTWMTIAYLLVWRNGQFRERWARFRRVESCKACGAMEMVEARSAEAAKGLRCPCCKKLEVEEVFIRCD